MLTSPIAQSDKELALPTTKWQVYRDSKPMAPMLLRHDVVLRAGKLYLQPHLAVLFCPWQAAVNEEEESDPEHEDLKKEPVRKVLLGLTWDKTRQPVKMKEFIHTPQWLMTEDFRLTVQKGKLRSGEVKCLEGSHARWEWAWSPTQVLLYYAKVMSCNAQQTVNKKGQFLANDLISAS